MQACLPSLLPSCAGSIGLHSQHNATIGGERGLPIVGHFQDQMHGLARFGWRCDHCHPFGIIMLKSHRTWECSGFTIVPPPKVQPIAIRIRRTAGIEDEPLAGLRTDRQDIR